MPAASDYTPLESLILFQSLERYGAGPEGFQKTSDILLRNEYVLEANQTDLDRLSVEGLRELYNYLLEQELQNGGAEDGDAASSDRPSKKRKLGSPPVLTRDSVNTPRSFSQLISRLYRRCRDAIIKSIREEETQILKLQQELQDLEVNGGGSESAIYHPHTTSQSFDSHPSAPVITHPNEQLPAPAKIISDSLPASPSSFTPPPSSTPSGLPYPSDALPRQPHKETSRFDRRQTTNPPPLATYVSPYLSNNTSQFGNQPRTSLPAHLQSEFRHTSENSSLSPKTPTAASPGINSRFPPLTVSTSSTKWKASPHNFPVSARGSPEPDEVSPISDKAPSPSPFPPPLPASLPKNTSRKGPSHNNNNTSPRPLNRGESAASSAGRGTTRSQSIASHPDEAFKREEGATPRFGIDDGPAPSIELPRKEEESFSNVAEPPDLSHVTSIKNFSRTTGPIMQMITGHRLASLFANPVKEKDAPGYHSMIYQPQDLKSIKSAITAGSRAVTAMQGASNIDSPAPGGGSSTPSKSGNEIVLPIAPELVPPKGIVNSAQLEKEVMRMFANAVMFNPDPNRGFGPELSGDSRQNNEDEDEVPTQSHYAEVDGGVVTDTREMFDAVSKQISTWRGSLKPRSSGTDRPMTTDSDVVEGESEVFTPVGERESTVDEAGPANVKRRRRG